MGVPQAEDAFKQDKFVLSVAQSPDGRRLASGSMDGSVVIFDLETGSLLHTLEGHFKPVRSLCFTPGSCILMSECALLLAQNAVCCIRMYGYR